MTPPARKNAALQAVILAAGKGSRLGKVADGLPKCLIQVGGRTLIRHQLDALADAGIGPVLVMIGYAADLVRETVGNAAEFILNPRYSATNSLHTFFLAREWIRGPVVILNSDVLADPRLLDALLRSGEDSLAYDSLSGYAREHMKVAVRDGRVVDLSKELPEEGTSGENVGMLYLGRRTLEAVLDEAERLVAAGRTDAFLAEAIRASLGRIELKAVDVAGVPWTEIDTPHDLERARRELWPRISERYSGRTGSWRARERRRKLGWIAAAVAAFGGVFAGARMTVGPETWETVAMSGVRDVSRTWGRLEAGESAAADVDGPRTVALDVRGPTSGTVLAEVQIDGARVDARRLGAGERRKIRLDVPAGRHRVAVRLPPGDPGALLVRLRASAEE